MHNSKRERTKRRRRGAAVVEFAVVSPLLLALVAGIIEFGWIFSIRQTMQNTAREACRLAVLKTTKAPYTEVVQRVTDLMQPTGITTYDLQLTHDAPVETVTLSVPYADVSLLGGFLGLSDFTLVGNCSMRKEE